MVQRKQITVMYKVGATHIKKMPEMEKPNRHNFPYTEFGTSAYCECLVNYEAHLASNCVTYNPACFNNRSIAATVTG